MIEKDFFVCPLCKDKLEKKEDRLLCLKCSKEYKILNSVYDFSNLELSEETKKTVEQFGKSWEMFSHIEDYHKKQFLEWIYPLKEEDFKDKVVLEAGCGKGRHSVIVSSFKVKHLFAVDLSEAIFVAEKNFFFFLEKSSPSLSTEAKINEVPKSGNLPQTPPERRGEILPITFVRSDLKKLPFGDNCFDVVFCVGVLHHIDNIEEALQELWRVLKPQGRLVLWVYGKEGNFWIIYFINPLRKFITSRIPTKLLRIFAFPLTLFLYLLLKIVYGPLTKWGKKESFLYYSSYLGSISPYPFKEIDNIVVDHLCPSIAYYLSKEDIEKITMPLNPSKFQLRWHHKNSWTCLIRK